MNKFEARLCGYVALATYCANKGFLKIFGEIPIWSNIDIQIRNGHDPDELGRESKRIHFFANLLHIPGTRHLYKSSVTVAVIKNSNDDWEFRNMWVTLHHHRMDEYIIDMKVDISLEPGIKSETAFSSKQSEVDDPILIFSELMPAYTSRFEIPA